MRQAIGIRHTVKGGHAQLLDPRHQGSVQGLGQLLDRQIDREILELVGLPSNPMC